MLTGLFIDAYSPIVEETFRDNGGGSGKPDAVFDAYRQGPGGCEDSDGAGDKPARDRCNGCAGGPRAGTVGFTRAAFPEADVDGVIINGVCVNGSDEGNVCAFNEARVVFDGLAYKCLLCLA